MASRLRGQGSGVRYHGPVRGEKCYSFSDGEGGFIKVRGSRAPDEKAQAAWRELTRIIRERIADGTLLPMERSGQ